MMITVFTPRSDGSEPVVAEIGAHSGVITPLKGKRALVTGASRGIGRATAEALCSAQARTVITALRPATLEAAANAMGAFGVAANLSDEAAASTVWKEAHSHLDGLDVLVLSSGAFLSGSVQSRSTLEFCEMLNANLIGPLALVRQCLPALIESRGDIVFVNSNVTEAQNIGGRALFAAGCHALKAIADGLRDEVNPLGVRVTSIFPGTTATDRTRSLREESGRPYVPERLLQPEDVAQTVLSVLLMSNTAEITDLYVRPRFKS